MALTASLRHARTVRKHCPQCNRVSNRLLPDGRAALCTACQIHLREVRGVWREARRVRGQCVDCGAVKTDERSQQDTCTACATCKAQKRDIRKSLRAGNLQ